MKNNYNTYPDNRDHLDCSKESSNPLQIVYDIYQDNRAHFDNNQKNFDKFSIELTGNRRDLLHKS